MRWCMSIGAMLVLGTMTAGKVDCIAAPIRTNEFVETRSAASVDLELVIAVDISYSMEAEELALQREGYAQALVSKEFLQALRNGPRGRMAIAYFEWSAWSDQKVIVPWRVIEGPESADAVASEIMKAPIRRGSRTSISGAISFAIPLFAENPYPGLRRVLDISGDGPNNNGPPVTGMRDEALAKGMTINGLPIMMKEPSSPWTDIKSLDVYYENCVTGGPGSFVLPIKDRNQIKDAIRTKLVLEVSSQTPEWKTVPVVEEQRVNCLVGEKMYHDRWGR